MPKYVILDYSLYPLETVVCVDRNVIISAILQNYIILVCHRHGLPWTGNGRQSSEELFDLATIVAGLIREVMK